MGTHVESAANETEPTMVVGLGASAGGVEGLAAVVSLLPATFMGAVFVVLHVTASGTEMLTRILDRCGPLPALQPVDGAAVHGGTIYVAPYDRHLLLDGDRIRVTGDPPENGYRPAIDTTFASLASFPGLVVGTVLSGALSDGTAGLAAVKAAGGVSLVQDPDEALHSSMILSAQRSADVDETLSLAGIAEKLIYLEAAQRRQRAYEAPAGPG